MNADILVPIAGMATGLVLLYPIVRMVVRVAERKLVGGGGGAALADVQDEVDRLRDQAAGAEDLAHRVAELEERVDFAERMLARPQGQALPGSE